VQNEAINFDGIVKELLEESSEKDVIRFINTLYEEDFPLDSSVTRLATETNSQGEQRRSDIMIAINERVFHAEIQSSPDSDMVFRMFDYGYRHALVHRKSVTIDTLELDFPDPVVIYLRNSEKTPTTFTINLNFPRNKAFSYKIPVKRIGDYTPDSLINGSLYALGPFYPMKYEKALTGEHGKEIAQRLADELTLILDWIDEKVEKGDISKSYAALFTNGLMKTMSKVTSKAKIVDKEAIDKVMENVQTRRYVLDPLNWREEGREQGREVGREEGKTQSRLETARRMKRKNLPIETIHEFTDLPIEEIQALQP